MPIRIVTDSTCDLPEDVITRYGIAVIPMYINMGESSFLDGVEISREEFYAQLPQYDPPPTTAVPGKDAFLKTYQRLAEEGAAEILSIHISSALSAVVNVAHLAAKGATSATVTVIDSGQLSLGTGFLAQTAAQAAVQDQPIHEIIRALEEQKGRTYVFAVLDTLEYLRRSGRMNGVIAGLGSLLRIKPILKMHSGEPTSIRVRTLERAITHLEDMTRALAPFEQIALVHTHAPERAAGLKNRIRSLLPDGNIPSVDITPVIGAHIGPGAAGFALVQAPGSEIES